MKCVLGLDISSSVIGIAIISGESEPEVILYTSSIDMRKIDCEYKKCDIAREALQKIKEKFEITDIFIEMAFKSFAGGKSSADTVAKLTRTNGQMSLVVRDVFDIIPALLDVNISRKNLKIHTISEKKHPLKLSVKVQVFEWLKQQKIAEHVTFPINKKGTLDKNIAYDISDAIVMALAGFQTLNSKV